MEIKYPPSKATPEMVKQFLEDNKASPIWGLAFPEEEGSNKRFRYADISGASLSPLDGDFYERMTDCDTAWQVANAAWNEGVKVAAYRGHDKWAVIPPVAETEIQKQHQADFKPFCPFKSSSEPPVVHFPVEALPEPLRSYCKAAAASYQVDEAMVGCCVLSVLSAVFQKCGYWVQVSPDWEEPTNLYTMITAAPSERKSPVLRDAMKPLIDALDAWNQEKAEQIEWLKKKVEVAKKKADNLTTSIAKRNAKVTEADLKAAQEELRAAEKEMLTPEQWLVDDTTPEALSIVLRDNKEVAALLSGEGGSILGILAGRYSAPGSGANIDIFLKGYSVEPTMIHRIGRQTVTLKHPRLTVLLMAQPSLLQDFVSNDSFSGRGLCARFLYCFPKSKVGTRSFISKSVPQDIRENYEKAISGLSKYALEWEQKDTALTVSREALSALEEYHNSVESLRPSMSDAMQSWSGKSEGNTVRIAALLFLVKNHGYIGEIDAGTMRGAVQIMRYFETMSQYALGFSQGNKARQDALLLLRRLSGDAFKPYIRRGAIKRRDLFKRLENTRFTSVNDLTPALRELESAGYLVQKDIRTNGRPSPTIIFNPVAFPGNE